jgi:hypothetical protein
MRLTLLGKNSKKPIVTDWVNKKISDEKVYAHKGNLGMKLGKGVACFDVDPKNGGFESVAKLEQIIGEKIRRVVKTPSGGWHGYLNTPDDGRKYKKNLKEFPGIDYLTHGSQCVIVSSSTDVGEYTWYDPDVGCFETFDAPQGVLDLFSRDPQINKEGADENEAPDSEDLDGFDALMNSSHSGVRLSSQAVKDLLSKLDPSMPNEEWVKVGMALKDWDKDEGFVLWEDWSKGGNNYEEGETGKRWPSFDTVAGEAGVTMGTIIHMAGAGTVAASPFEEVQHNITSDLSVLGFSEAPVNWGPISSAEQRCFVGKGGRRHIISNDGSIIDVVKDIGPKILKQEFGQFVNGKIVANFISQNGADFDTTAKTNALKKQVSNMVMDAFWATIARTKTVGSLQLQVDMFATEIETNINRDVGTITLPFTSIVGDGFVDDDCVDDFKNHAPVFDKIILFILYSRFASNAKTSYLWLHCDSNWGKGFLFGKTGVFGGLGITVEISVKEIENAMEGKPVGISRFAMIDQFALVVDEFKQVRSEIKLLDNTLTASPKNEMRFTAPLYAKIFMSAETVPSLVGEAGVETQFANRICYIRGKGSLAERQMFRSKGAIVYMKAVREYARVKLMEGVERLTALGAIGAAKEADDWLEAFHEEHGLGKQFSALNNTVDEIAAVISDAFISVCTAMDDDPVLRPSDAVASNVPSKFKWLLDECFEPVRWQGEPVYLVSKLSKLCDAWIEGTYDKSEIAKVRYKRAEIATLVDQKLFPERTGDTTKVFTKNHPHGRSVRGTICGSL